mgnify:CR=1 FL=1
MGWLAWTTSAEGWIALLTLTVLEIVLGIDNIVFISILTGKLRPEQRQHFPCRERDVESAPDCVVWVTDGEIVAFDVHDQVLCMLARSQMKNGVPTTAVRMPRGISTWAAVRARVSMTSR